ncbi:unnamed protein product [Cuscuta epithymum]|uniref:Uncharacterized protein n=1 Tax=Cuscuta epithymum TaxID=186058 RepID=A0AAV0E5Y2_9ASTE|nr:unnamed protein product [Cuscuta epithymum]CAH9147033.1 unnamed protein product [Cuscuta epithymum]
MYTKSFIFWLYSFPFLAWKTKAGSSAFLSVGTGSHGFVLWCFQDVWKPRKPIQVAAQYGRVGVVKVLFPHTTPIKGYAEWSIDRILSDMQRGSLGRGIYFIICFGYTSPLLQK